MPGNGLAFAIRVGREIEGFGLLQRTNDSVDVFLAALLIGLSQISVYIGFESRIGLYLFTAGVVLNNVATLRLSFSRVGKDAI